MVDATVGATYADATVAAVLRRSGKPVVVAANKVDDTKAEPEVAALWSLGLGEPVPVSALHGQGDGSLLDVILDALPDAPKEADEAEGGPRRVALLGRPNVGKSSLLNKLAGHERSLVDPVAGTTRDPVDELIELGGTTWRFVDTAGIRRRFRENQGADYYAALRTAGALDRAEVAVVLIDASEPLTEQDLRIVSMVIEAGRALVIAYNTALRSAVSLRKGEPHESDSICRVAARLLCSVRGVLPDRCGLDPLRCPPVPTAVIRKSRMPSIMPRRMT